MLRLVTGPLTFLTIPCGRCTCISQTFLGQTTAQLALEMTHFVSQTRDKCSYGINP